MSDEALEAARRIERRCQQLLLAKINPERDLIGFGDAMVVARALLAREAEREAEVEKVAEAIWHARAEHFGEPAKPLVKDERWELCLTYARAALKTAGEPSADGGKCEHDYEAHDDKGWECKKCGHQT